MLIDHTHGRLWLRGKIYTFSNNLASICNNICFISVYISLTFFWRIKQKIETRIFVLEVELQHFLAVVYLISIRVSNCQCIVKFILNCVRIIGRIGIFFIQNILNRGILCSIYLKTAAVQKVSCLGLGITFDVHQIIDDLVSKFILEIGVNCIFCAGILFLSSLNTGINIIRQCLIVLILCNIILIQHMLKNFFPSLLVAVRISDRVKLGRILCDTCKCCTFRQIQIPYIFVKILPGSCLYAIGSCSQVDSIQIVLKDCVFVGFLFNLNGKVLFLEFTRKSFKLCRFTGPVGKYIIFQQLLSDCTGTFGKISGSDCLHSGTKNTFYINTIVLIETFILNGNYCMLQIFGNLIQCDRQSV